jgi:hypothetical protein
MEVVNMINAETSSTAIRFLEEIAFIIAAQNLTPTMISQDFLKSSGIIPQDWELAQQPVLNPTVAQLNFTNGVNLLARPGTLTISESMGKKNLDELQGSAIATRYIEKLPHAEYLGFSLSPKILVPCSGDSDFARKYITRTLLAQGSWQGIGKAPLQGAINLIFELEKCQLSMSISEAKLQFPQQTVTNALLFSGNFNYDLVKETSPAKLNKLVQGINFWRTDFQMFREITTQKFLANANLGQFTQEETVFPIGAM